MIPRSLRWLADGIQSIEAAPNFIMLLVGAAWRAQQPDRMRRIGVFITADNDPQTRRFLTVFKLALQEARLDGGREIQVGYRFGASDVERFSG